MKPTSLTLVEHAITCFYHTPEAGVSLEDVLAPDYWAHVAGKMLAGSRVEVFAQDGAWWAMLIVRSSSKNEARVYPITHAVFDGAAPESDGEAFEVKWRGPAKRHSVVRKSDGAILRDEFQTKEEATTWMTGHVTAMAN